MVSLRPVFGGCTLQATICGSELIVRQASVIVTPAENDIHPRDRLLDEWMPWQGRDGAGRKVIG